VGSWHGGIIGEEGGGGQGDRVKRWQGGKVRAGLGRGYRWQAGGYLGVDRFGGWGGECVRFTFLESL
jgi:hypothetical protein